MGQDFLAGDQSEAGKLGLEWLPQFSYSEAAIGADVYHADVVILDVRMEPLPIRYWSCAERCGETALPYNSSF